MRILANCLFALLFIISCRSDKGSSVAVNTANAPTNDGLKLHTYRYLVQDHELYQNYQQKSGKAVNVYLSDSKQLVAAAEAGSLKADLVIANDIYTAHRLKQAGVLQPYNAGTFGQYVPNRFVDREGYWAGISSWTMSFIFRESAFPDMRAFQTYSDAIQPNLQGRIAIAHPDSSGLTAMVASMIAAHGVEPTQLYLQSLMANLAAPPGGNDLDALQMVINGQADVALIRGSLFLQYRNSGNPEAFKSTDGLGIEIPVDANGDNYYNINPICILKDTPQRDYAITFVEFLTLQSNQAISVPAGMEYPVNVFTEMSDFLYDTYNVPEGHIGPEETEPHLDTARALIQQVFGL